MLTPSLLWPVAYYSSQNAFSGPGEIAFKKLRILLERVMLRRTKLERADDLGLPPRTVIVRRDHFSPEEKELYLSLFTDAKRQFSTYVKKGTLLNSVYFLTFARVLLIRSADYSNIFSLITRMRQMVCLHISAVRALSYIGLRRAIPISS